jgi:hypothetical protein
MIQHSQTTQYFSIYKCVLFSWKVIKHFSFVVCEGHGSISQQNKQIFNISNAPNILISTVSCNLIFVIA